MEPEHEAVEDMAPGLTGRVPRQIVHDVRGKRVLAVHKQYPAQTTRILGEVIIEAKTVGDHHRYREFKPAEFNEIKQALAKRLKLDPESFTH